jgi:hypothetical protein
MTGTTSPFTARMRHDCCTASSKLPVIFSMAVRRRLPTLWPPRDPVSNR